MPVTATDPNGGVSTSQAGPNAPTTADTVYPAYRWLAAWAVLLLILWLLNRTTLGHLAIYYALALCLLFLLVTNSQAISWWLAPFTGRKSLNP